MTRNPRDVASSAHIKTVASFGRSSVQRENRVFTATDQGHPPYRSPYVGGSNCESSTSHVCTRIGSFSHFLFFIFSKFYFYGLRKCASPPFRKRKIHFVLELFLKPLNARWRDLRPTPRLEWKTIHRERNFFFFFFLLLLLVQRIDAFTLRVCLHT